MFKPLAVALSLLFGIAPASAAGLSLSALSAGSAISGSNLFYAVQTVGVGGVKVTATQIGTYISSVITGQANSWTAAQTFTNSDILMLGSSTGATTITSDNAGASNFTQHLQAANGVVALTSQLAALPLSAANGGTGVNNGTSTITTASALIFTGTGGPTFATPSSPFTYTFQGSSDTIVGRATTDTLTNKTLTTPTVNGAALSGTLSGTPTYSGVPIFSGLSAGTQVSCLGLDSGNHLVLNASACGSGGGTFTANSTATSGFTAQHMPYSDGSLIQDGGTSALLVNASANGTNTFTNLTSGSAINASFAVQRNSSQANANFVGAYIDLSASANNHNMTGVEADLFTPSGDTGISSLLEAFSGNVTISNTAGFSNAIAFFANTKLTSATTCSCSLVNFWAFGLTNSGGGSVSNADQIRISTPAGATTGLTSTWGEISGVNIADMKPSGTGTNVLTNPPAAIEIASQTATGAFAIQQVGSGINSFASGATFGAPFLSHAYTVSTLPASPGQGARAHVTDQLTACVATGVALTGGGSVVCPTFYNGTAWVGG